MKFPKEKFDKFCAHLKIDSKEQGQIPLKMLGTQTYMLDEITKGLDESIHMFVVLKGRQLGISTASLALDLFWLYSHKGLQGMLATDSDSNRDFFRSVLDEYMDSLPARFKINKRAHNRAMLWLKNRSKLNYLTMGTRKSGSGNKGRGKGINFLHGTECSSWGDEEAVASLISTLAETNPNRLYLFESTARGWNLFYDMWKEAKTAKTQRPIFVGWWRNELYRAERGTKVYDVYWDGVYTGEEREWIQQVKFYYDWTITPEQIAWSRWKSEELIKDGQLMMQEFPPTEDYAFILTGSRFFSSEKLTDAYKKIIAEPAPKYMRYTIGSSFDQIELHDTNAENATLKIWEEPYPNGVYVLGCDPAYGSSENKDRFAIQVFRCYSDGLDQVAEYLTSEGYMYSFAWIIAHLAGAYRNSTVLIEVNGPGMAVLQEFRALTERATGIRAEQAGPLKKVLGNIAHFLYRRPDSMSGHAMLHWKSSAPLKERIMNRLRDCFERGILRPRSLALIDEMKHITNDEGTIGASGRAKDDATIAAALGVECWAEQVLPELEARGLSRRVSAAIGPVGEAAEEVGQRMIANFLKNIGA